MSSLPIADYGREGLRYPSDQTDAEWALAKPFIAVGKFATTQWEARLRAVLDAVLYVLTTGCQWRQLPKDFPPRSTVHGWFVRSHCDGVLDRLRTALYRQGSARAEVLFSRALLWCPAGPPAAPSTVSCGRARMYRDRAPIRFGRAICGDLDQAERREWWLTNGLGAYVAGTVADTLTRRYHGLLIAPIDPPLRRRLVFTKAQKPMPRSSPAGARGRCTPISGATG
jgi:transposase